MRNNQPVTQDEYPITEQMVLVSKTDLHGNIIEVNDAFETASGFTRDELLGQPHNLVRHPSVPEAVFKDLWATLKQGSTWSQILKNRRKDGGYYWVRANVTPVYKEGQVTGYMSYRTSVTAAEKQAAAQAYEDISRGRLKIRKARLYSGVDWQRLNPFLTWRPEFQLLLFLTVFAVLPTTVLTILANQPIWEALVLAALFLIPPFWMMRSLTKDCTARQEDLKKIASGEMIGLQNTDNLSFKGRFHDTIIASAIGARYIEESALEQLDKARQTQEGLDRVSANVMMTDANYNITYINQNMERFFKAREAKLQTLLPDFRTENIVGSNIDDFHKNPGHQRSMLAQLKEPTSLDLTVGDIHVELLITPVFNRNGNSVGLSVEWRDRTPEVVLLDQVKATIDGARAGNLERRIDTNQVEGVIKEVSEAINSLLETVEVPINQAIEVGLAISEGRLTQRVEGELYGRFSVLKDALNVACENMGSMINQTKRAVTLVGDGAGEMSQSSIQLNDRTQQQAASIEETAATMEQITAQVKQNADNAVEASQVTHQTANLAEEGVSVMANAIESMSQIQASSERINDIISLIDSIAFQTNLLALNAAVEAARAGEHGRGFAVVAGEVRNLAQKSSDAAKEIRGLIEDTVHKVTEGTHFVKGSGESLNSIAQSIQDVNKLIDEMARSSHEQADGIDQINQAIGNIDSAVQQNAALVEESTAISEQLGHMSTDMMNTVSHFETTESATQAIFSAADTAGFDFTQARRAHRLWRVKVNAYLNGLKSDIDPVTATDGSRCELGQWIYGEGRAYSGLNSYRALEKVHAELHSFIGQILQLEEAGDMDQALIELGQLDALSLEVVQAIRTLEGDIVRAGQTQRLS
ncbi:MAG: methyl-accepting chemotaxis protein [Hydrogenovibrio sp.]